MSRRHWPWFLVLGLSVLLLGVYGITQAAPYTQGSGPGDALPVPDGWQTLAPGQQTWYAFDYGGDKSEIRVQMSASPAGSASFAIWSPTDVERWFHGGAAVPSGRGSPNASFGGDLFWSGSSGLPGTWYVAVEPSGPNQTWYDLKVGGSSVTPHVALSPTPSPAESEPASVLAQTPAYFALAPASTPAPPALPGAVATPDRYGLAYVHPPTPTPTPPGQYPNDALPVPDGPQTLEPGQHVWYAFEYAGDRSRILIQLHADPPGSATFTVWSWDVLQRWTEGYFYTPTGRGTANDVYGGDLIWFGGSIIKGKWYIIVEQNGPSTSTYTLKISGTGVDTTLPTPTPTPTPTYSVLQSVTGGQ